MDWFTEVFMVSLIKRLDNAKSNQIWISEKQTNICKKYMKPKSVWDGYYIIIGEYQYDVSQMKKGYGRLSRIDRRIGIR